MEQIYDVLKSFVDPLFIIFVLLIISFFICLASGKKKGGALLLLLVIVLLYGFSIGPVSGFLSYKLEKNYIRDHRVEESGPLDVIVVLGGGISDIQVLGKTFPAESTAARLVHAVCMYKAHNAKFLVCSGTGHNKVSNAELMAQMAQVLGVPRERIRVEAKSRNTYEHAIEFNKMFTDKALKIGLVTSAYHMKRSEKEFKKYFKKVLPLPASYLYSSPVGTPALRYIPQSQCLSDNTLVIREFMGQIWYSLKDF